MDNPGSARHVHVDIKSQHFTAANEKALTNLLEVRIIQGIEDPFAKVL